MVWIQWVVRLLTQKWFGYSGWSDYSHTEMLWLQWVVKLLTHRNGLGILTEVVRVMVRLLIQRN